MSDNQKIQQLRESTVYGSDGEKIGQVGDVYLDDQTNEPTFATVNTGLFGSKKTFVPLDRAQYGQGRIEVPFEKSFVKDAPNIDDDGSLTPEEEQRIYEYYQLDGAGQDRGSQDDRRREGDRAHHDEAAVAGAAAGREDRAERTHDARDERHAANERTAADRNAYNNATDPDRDEIVAHEEHLRATGDTERRQTGQLRLRKHVTTHTETVEVPVRREEISVERENIDPSSKEARTGQSYDFDGKEGAEDVTVTAYEERPVVSTETVASERVRVNKDVAEESQRVSGEVRKEEIDIDEGKGQRK